MKPRFEGRTRRWARVVCTGLVLMAPLAPVWAVEYVWLCLLYTSDAADE